MFCETNQDYGDQAIQICQHKWKDFLALSTRMESRKNNKVYLQ